jgi:hypothetical protein
MLFRETVPVYCENHMKHTNATYGQNFFGYDTVKAELATTQHYSL